LQRLEVRLPEVEVDPVVPLAPQRTGFEDDPVQGRLLVATRRSGIRQPRPPVHGVDEADDPADVARAAGVTRG
jgi:hypothetical protein